jgi:hypothetical protein
MAGWAVSNPRIFASPNGALNYSRFPPGEVGTTVNGTPETGTHSTPEAQFPIPPGSPAPTAWLSNLGNLLGPGGKTNAAPSTPSGVSSESQYAANS